MKNLLLFKVIIYQIPNVISNLNAPLLVIKNKFIIILSIIIVAILVNIYNTLAQDVNSEKNMSVSDNSGKLINKDMNSTQKELNNESPNKEKESTNNTIISNIKELKEYKYSNWSGSLMFNDSAMNSLSKAIVEFKTNHHLRKSSSVNNAKASFANNISPSFYLGSIMFNSINNWTIWINNKKLTSEKKYDLQLIAPKLELISINEDYIVLSWTNKTLDNLSPNWRNKLSLAKDNNYYNANNRINITNDNSVVNFLLYPNQTFSVYDMDIIEGFVPEHKLVSKNLDK